VITLHWIAILVRSCDVCSDRSYQKYWCCPDRLWTMELRHLRYFCAVAEERSFTLAARRLHISQSGVSGQVRDLEQELGVALFRRNQRSVSLTPEGSAFLSEARDILDRADRAVEMVAQAIKGRCGRLKIGLCGPATAPFLPRLIREFRRRLPGISLSLRDLDPAHQPGALVSGEIDIGFTRGIPAALRGTLASEVFFHESLVAALPKGHRLENSSALSLKDLATDRFVLYARENAPELSDAILSLCKRARFSPNIVDTPSLWQSVLTMIEAGEGISIVPETVKHLQSRDVAFRPLRDRGCTVDVVLAWRANAPDAVRESFLTLLRTHQAEVKRSLNRR
jgi:DNA-binding transcriptional LysR family regulator